MVDRCYITDPAEDIRTLALAYVQSQNLAAMRPEAVLNLYNDTLTKMWKQYEVIIDSF